MGSRKRVKVNLLSKDAAAPSSKSTGVFSKELKVLMSLVGGIPAMEGETRRFLNIAKPRRGEERKGRCGERFEIRNLQR